MFNAIDFPRNLLKLDFFHISKCGTYKFTILFRQMLESKKFDLILNVLLILAWLQLPFFNFDLHQDSSMLTTVRLTKISETQNSIYTS